MIVELITVLNFLMLLFVGWWAVRTYVAPGLVEEWRRSQARAEGLQSEQSIVLEKQRELSQKITQKEAYFQELEQKVLAWKLAVNELISRQTREYDLRLAEVFARERVVAEQRAALLIRKELLPGVIADIERDLKREFSNESLTKRYVHHVVDTLVRG